MIIIKHKVGSFSAVAHLVSTEQTKLSVARVVGFFDGSAIDEMKKQGVIEEVNQAKIIEQYYFSPSIIQDVNQSQYYKLLHSADK